MPHTLRADFVISRVNQYHNCLHTSLKFHYIYLFCSVWAVFLKKRAQSKDNSCVPLRNCVKLPIQIRVTSSVTTAYVLPDLSTGRTSTLGLSEDK